MVALREAIFSLRRFPRRGRPGAVEGARELLHERLPYIVAYRVKEDAVEILHIWHPVPAAREASLGGKEAVSPHAKAPLPAEDARNGAPDSC